MFPAGINPCVPLSLSREPWREVETEEQDPCDEITEKGTTGCFDGNLMARFMFLFFFLFFFFSSFFLVRQIWREIKTILSIEIHVARFGGFHPTE